jgi:opacity protein-like surface antigen
MNRRLVALAATSLAVLVPVAQAAAHPQTTAPPPVVDIRVTITDSGIHFAPKHAVRGAFARFILVNTGARAHVLALGTAKKGSGVQTGFKKQLKPKEQKILLLFLDYRGKVPYSAPLPTDRTKRAMKGVFTIS